MSGEMPNIIQKLKKSQLLGRGGACFPVWKKWEMVKNAEGDKKYIVCNASEGEPGVLKDGYILKAYPERVVDGITIAMEFLEADKAYIYINASYYDKYSGILKKLIGAKNIELFRKPHRAGYIGGAETALLNNLEGKHAEPRLKPPYPTTNGLWGCPTLVNNVETFLEVSLVNADVYRHTRFYTVSGDCIHHGVYEYPVSYSIKDILEKTDNYPDFDFFVQVGGDGAGSVYNSRQLDLCVEGSGSITIYSEKKHEPIDLIKNWVVFFRDESCGQCTPCREGTYRLKEILNRKNVNWPAFFELLDVMDETSLCALGKSVSIPIRSYLDNVLNNKQYG